MHGGMHEFIVSTWYVLLCVSWIVMFVDIDYRVLFAHGLVRFVGSWSLGGELTRMRWYIGRTFLLACFATCRVLCHANMTLGIVLVWRM